MEAPGTPAGANVPLTKRFAGLTGWFLESFGPLIAFFVCLKVWGLLAAIVCGIVTGAALVAYKFYETRKASAFTIYSAVAVIVFGALDLKYQTGFFVKLEPALGNTATGLFFLTSVIIGKPVVIEFAEKMAGQPLPHARRYLGGWTLVWALFFFVRAGVFLWIAYNMSLEQSLIIRGTVMPLSFGAMFLIELVVRRIVFGKKSTQPAPALATAKITEGSSPPTDGVG